MYESGFIARDQNGDLYFYNKKPYLGAYGTWVKSEFSNSVSIKLPHRSWTGVFPGKCVEVRLSFEPLNDKKYNKFDSCPICNRKDSEI